jgi:uncharacterized cupin superfamily protein
LVGTNIDYSKSEGVLEQEKFPYILTVEEDAEPVMDNSAFKVRDMYFEGIDGFVKWTTAITNLRPGRQTRGHAHPDNNELCRIIAGECFIVIDDISYRVKAGKYILIEKGKHHKVINVSVSDECVFVSDFPGHLIRPGYVRKR